jgi:hypothetical protein
MRAIAVRASPPPSSRKYAIVPSQPASPSWLCVPVSIDQLRPGLGSDGSSAVKNRSASSGCA